MKACSEAETVVVKLASLREDYLNQVQRDFLSRCHFRDFSTPSEWFLRTVRIVMRPQGGNTCLCFSRLAWLFQHPTPCAAWCWWWCIAAEWSCLER